MSDQFVSMKIETVGSVKCFALEEGGKILRFDTLNPQWLGMMRGLPLEYEGTPDVRMHTYCNGEVIAVASIGWRKMGDLKICVEGFGTLWDFFPASAVPGDEVKIFAGFEIHPLILAEWKWSNQFSPENRREHDGEEEIPLSTRFFLWSAEE